MSPPSPHTQPLQPLSSGLGAGTAAAHSTRPEASAHLSSSGRCLSAAQAETTPGSRDQQGSGLGRGLPRSRRTLASAPILSPYPFRCCPGPRPSPRAPGIVPCPQSPRRTDRRRDRREFMGVITSLSRLVSAAYMRERRTGAWGGGRWGWRGDGGGGEVGAAISRACGNSMAREAGR